MDIIDFCEYTNKHPKEGVNFKEQPEPIKWLIVDAGISRSGCQDQGCSQKCHEYQVCHEGNAAHKQKMYQV